MSVFFLSLQLKFNLTVNRRPAVFLRQACRRVGKDGGRDRLLVEEDAEGTQAFQQNLLRPSEMRCDFCDSVIAHIYSAITNHKIPLTDKACKITKLQYNERGPAVQGVRPDNCCTYGRKYS